MKFSLALVSLVALSTIAAANPNPRPGFKKLTQRQGFGIQSVTYWLSETQKTWAEASADCRDNDGKLIAPSSITIDTDKLANIITDNGLTATTAVWTDARFDNSVYPGKWIWHSSRRAFTYTNWAPGQPTTPTTNSCVAARGQYTSYGWYVYPCASSLRYVCVNQD